MASDLANSVDYYRVEARSRERYAVLFAFGLSVVAAVLLIASPPGWLAVTLCAGIAFALVTWYRPVVGVGLVLAPTLLFEQFDFAVFRPLTAQVPFFAAASNITGGGGVKASPLEILLVTVAVIVLLRVTVGRKDTRRNPLATPVLVFVAGMVAWTLYGLLVGGALNVAVWEVRALSYFCLLAIVVPQTIDSERDARLLLWVAICLIGLKSAQGLWNLFIVRQNDLMVRSITSHEDAVFIAWMAVFLIALLVYRAGGRQRHVLIALSPIMALTFVKTDRRAAYVALALGLVILLVLVATDRDRRAVIVKRGLPILVAALLIVGVGWSVPGPLGAPAAVVRSIVAPDNPEDAGSSFFRVIEELNLMQSIQANPVVGIGFGRPFQQPGQNGIAILNYELANVIAHNSVFWIWAVMGTLGFALFWVMVGSFIAFGGIAFRSSSDPYAKAVAGMVTAAVAMQVIVSFVDLQLTYARNMVFLGVLVGILAALPSLAKSGSTRAS